MEKPVTAMSNKTVIHILSFENHELAGYLYSDYYEENYPFKTAWEMMDILESLYNKLSFPQVSFEFRSFGDEKGESVRSEVGLLNNSKQEENEIKTEPSSKATFVVRVQFRQNATWQGTVDWLDGKKSKHFRSTLELLKLMDEAIAKEEPEHITEW